MINPQYSDQTQRRLRALQTPATFYAAVGTGTAVYTGQADEFFLIRAFSVSNPTGSAISLTLTVGGNNWVTGAQVSANSVSTVEGIAGQMLEDGVDIVASGAGLIIFGWGLRIRGGGDAWTL